MEDWRKSCAVANAQAEFDRSWGSNVVMIGMVQGALASEAHQLLSAIVPNSCSTFAKPWCSSSEAMAGAPGPSKTVAASLSCLVAARDHAILEMPWQCASAVESVGAVLGLPVGVLPMAPRLANLQAVLATF